MHAPERTAKQSIFSVSPLGIRETSHPSSRPLC